MGIEVPSRQHFKSIKDEKQRHLVSKMKNRIFFGISIPKVLELGTFSNYTLGDEMGQVTNSSKTSGYCRAGTEVFKKIPDERQRITLWLPFTIENMVQNDSLYKIIITSEFPGSKFLIFDFESCLRNHSNSIQQLLLD